MVLVRSSGVYINWKLEVFLLWSLGGSNMVNYLKHIYQWWIGLPDSILIDVSVLFTLRWCCLDKIWSPASFLGLTYLVEVSYFMAFLALCILGCTLLSWLVLWFSTSHTLPFHSWGFLDGWLWFEVPCAPELFCPWFLPLAHFDLLLFPFSCLQLYAAKFTEELELSWDRILCWALQSSIASWFIRNSTVSSFASSFIRLIALSLAHWLFIPKKITSLIALSSASGFRNLHLLAILTMWEWNSPDVIEPCLAKCNSSTANNGFDLGASKRSNNVK